MSQSVSLSRELYLPRSLVFDAWTQAEHVAEWFPPADGRLQAVVVQPTSGGRFELSWRDAAGERFEQAGEFVEIERPSGFLCNVTCRGADGGTEQIRLRVSLTDLVDACRLELTQEGSELEGEQVVRDAWERRLDRLEAYFSAI